MVSLSVQKVIEADISKSAKIRELKSLGMKTADIARALDIRYQHARNVLLAESKKAFQTKGSGLSEAKQAGLEVLQSKVRLGPDGRVVIPAAFREALGIGEGDTLFARVENGEINLLTPSGVMRRVNAMAREFVPEGVSLADELIAERRREAAEE
ncbi:MAG: AbrB/MazE/SpoVT family DNA-binding domain-containing protein [Xanthobacteraceae bacterium]|nr:AbrB/MazE/SpoVT family DNA-binding domain-containing protein [Xanthobacteraceae bacterium]MCW5681703.1 AbrB/MazE/SpoVT family DNA-binding domain-containing protein [Xanthobacteraceae bacterium]